MSFEITESFVNELNTYFWDFLEQKGSRLINHVRIENVQGHSKIVSQFDWRDSEDSTVQNESRILEPKPITQRITVSNTDIIRQGKQPTADKLAEKLATNCVADIDKIIINGINGRTRTLQSEDIELPISQYICVDSWQHVNSGNTLVGQGLTTQKILQAVTHLRQKHNSALICVCSNKALGQLMPDKSASELLIRAQDIANGCKIPYAGIDFFIALEAVPKKVRAHLSAGDNLKMIDSETAKQSKVGEVELAYVYASDQIALGCNKEFTLQVVENAGRNFDWVFQYSGKYDAVRIREDAVVAIEVNARNKIITE